jgi:hypothetical protein
LGLPVPDEQTAAALAQPLVEIPEAFEQELGSGTGGVTPGEQPVVKAEHRDQALAGLRGAKRRMVVQAQIAPQP